MERLRKAILELGLGRQEIPEVVDESQFESGLELAAYRLAKEAHQGQFRKQNNKEYLTHPVAVWWICRYLGVKDHEILAAALLHDTVEDTAVTGATIVSLFGERVFHLVEGVSELTDADKTLAERKTRERTLSSSGLDYGVAVVKFADRLHNTITLGAMSPEKRMVKARQTLEFVVKLASVYKMWDAAIMLSDLSFPFAYPEVWEEEAPKIASDPRLRPEFIRQRLAELEQLMRQSNIEGRSKGIFGGYYRSYQSLLRKGADYAGINDLMSLEVVVSDEENCYRLLGVIHKLYAEAKVPGAFLDYLCAPTFDGYSALQTTVNFPSYGLVKYVITTADRSDYNHRGVLAVVENEKGTGIQRAKLVRDTNGGMIVLPGAGTVFDAAWGLYPNEVARAVGFEVNGKAVDPSSGIDHGAVLALVLMGDDDWSRFGGVTCSSATKHALVERKAAEERRAQTKQGKEKMSLYLRALRIGLYGLDDLDYVDGGDWFLKGLVTNFIGNQGDRDDLYFALSRDCGLAPDSVAQWLVNNGFAKERWGLATVFLEVVDRPGILHCLTGAIGQTDGGINICRFEQNKKRGQEGVAVLKFILTGVGRDREGELLDSLRATGGVLKVMMV